MKDYVAIVTQGTVDSLCEVAIKAEIDIDFYEGVLIDNYIFNDTSNIRMGNIKPRKYIIIREKYVSSQSSAYEMIMTDSEKTRDEWETEFRKYLKEDE